MSSFLLLSCRARHRCIAVDSYLVTLTRDSDGDVTWFVRTLPQGWHPSLEAITEAAKRGIELYDNETFVKEHKRGSIHERVVGYHAIRRQNK